MDIVFLNHNVAWKGGFFRAYHWGRHLVRRGHNVTLLTISRQNRWHFEVQQRDGIRLVETPDLLTGRLRSGWDLWDTVRRTSFLLRQSFDLIHCVDSRPVCILPALTVKKCKGTKLVLDWGDWWGRGGTIVERAQSRLEHLFSPAETFFEERFRRYADGSVVLTSALQRRAIALGVAADSIIRIPHGADIDGIKPLDKWMTREKLGILQRESIVGYVGNMLLADADLLLQAFEIVRNHRSHVRLFLIGYSQNIRVHRKLLDSGAVLITGPVSYQVLQDYIAACDAMLLPLKNSVANAGRWPSKLGDYLAAGRPVVACKVGDIAQLLEGSCCSVLTEDTPEAFAVGIINLLRDGDLENMGKHARHLAETRLAWDGLTDQLERFYMAIYHSNPQ